MRQLHRHTLFALSLATVLYFAACNLAPKEADKKALAAKVQRGDYLVNAVANCMHCHADRDFTKFSGPTVPGTEGKGGQRKGVPVPNITPTVLGSWTDEEIVTALTTGMNKAGDTLYPTMPYMSYQYLTSYDAESIAAYLRTLKPIADTVSKRDLGQLPPGRLTALFHEWYQNDIYESLDTQHLDGELRKGKYLVTIGGCIACHTNLDAKTRAFKKDSAFAGGQLSNKPGNNFKVMSANITPDSATGIGAWTEDMFLAKFAGYRNRKAYDYAPGKFNSEMPWTIFANMTDDDIRLVYRYLRTVKPVRHQVTKWRE